MPDDTVSARLFAAIAGSYGEKSAPGPRGWNAFGTVCLMVVNGAADPVTGFYAYGFNIGSPPHLGDRYSAAKSGEIARDLKDYSIKLLNGFAALAVDNHPGDFSSPQAMRDRIVEGSLAARYLDYMVASRDALLGAARRDDAHRPGKLPPSLLVSEAVLRHVTRLTRDYAALGLTPPGEAAIDFALAAKLAGAADQPLRRCNRTIHGVAKVAGSMVFHG